VDHLSIGIVGSSFWAEFAYLQRLTDHPRAKFVALCARDQQRAQSIAGKYGISRIEADWRRLLDKHDLDALIVVAPDDLHKEIVLSACERKLAVLCEKPLANSATDAWTMQRAAAQAGITNMVMFTWRWQPHFVFLNDLLKRGELGRPLRAQLGFLAGYMRTPEYSWRMDPRRSNGNFADLGSHMIDLARFFFGDPSSVTAGHGHRPQPGLGSRGRSRQRQRARPLGLRRWPAGVHRDELRHADGRPVHDSDLQVGDHNHESRPRLSLCRQ